MINPVRSLLFTAVLLFPCIGLGQPSSAVQAVESFYNHYRKLKLSGLPNAKEAAQLAPYLSKGLQALIRKAQTEQARCIKAEPDDKGPWVEGDLFTSNFEGFSRFQVNATAQARIPVAFTYTENGQAFSWKDEVGMIPEDGRWVVDDVFYRSTPGFTSGFGSNLRGSLTAPACPSKQTKR